MKTSSEKVVLFNDKKDCCGCGACMNICPKDAIVMKEDEHGYLYPFIVYVKCISCGMCKKVCSYQDKTKPNTVDSTWVAAAKNDELIARSASGGIFSVIASEVINRKNGVVFGCAFEKIDGKLTPKHIKVTNMEGLKKLQGSKYVQSFIGNVYKEVKQELITGKFVLFSGTPCQVEGLQGYLGKHYENLLAIDLICHGVPSTKFFQEYIKCLENKLKGTVHDFKFRDKTKGWGLRGKVEYYDLKGKYKYKLFTPALSSYYMLFLRGDIYRGNCYSCKYACENRVGDLTIGDYWGIGKEHPEYLVESGGTFYEKRGISCVLVNTELGKRVLSDMKLELYLKPSTFQKAAANNGQLREPCLASNYRTEILEIYSTAGYSGVEQWYFKRLGIRKYIHILWNLTPVGVQKIIKKVVRI